ncbi:MAG: cytidine deaminase [Nitrospinae bacterium]|nr:cytidine deaminase [Nitrospinota bacterium]
MDNDKPDSLVTDDDLISIARQAMENAYAPYSKFRVGAAALTSDGRIFTGVNVENASYGLTVCAERVAVFKAVSEGFTRITRLAVVSSSGEKTFPCGACRQVISEFGDVAIVIAADGGEPARMGIRELLPSPFGGDSIK